MRWNPFLTRRGRIMAAAAGLLMTAVGYLASYPIAYRIVIGADPVVKYDWAVILFPPKMTKAQKAERLEQYFMPVMWLMDNTPCHHPVRWIARIVDTDKQIDDDMRWRQVFHAFDAQFPPRKKTTTGNLRLPW